MTNPKNATRRDRQMLHIAPPLIVFLAFLVATFWSWQTARDRYDREYEQATQQSTAQVERSIRENMATYETALRSSAALFHSSTSVNRSEWETFQKVFRNPARIQGVTEVAFAVQLDRSQLDQHISQMQSEGFDKYRVFPKTSHNIVVPIIFPISHVTPANAANSRALGLDMNSNDARRQAMEEAAKSNSPIVSDKIRVRRNKGDREELAFVMFFPVYKPGGNLATAASRKDAVFGYVYAPLFTNNLFDHIFNDNRDTDIGFQVYDTKIEPASLVYQSNLFDSKNNQNTFSRTVEVNNHKWQIVYAPSSAIVARNVRRGPLSALIGGVVFSMLISGLVWALLVSRTRSIAYTEEKEVQQAKDDILSIASHQLRTPATGVKQYLGMVSSGFAGELTRQQAKLIKQAYISNERQLHIIDEMLHVARIDTGRIKLRYKDVDLTKLVNEIIKEQSATIKERKQNLEFKPARKALVIKADRQYLRMAVENIISNASKYTPNGGTITIKLHRGSESAMISVADTGVGIEKQDFPLVFQKFSRIHNELSRQTAGSGVGLYVAKKIVDLHGGTISFESRAGLGTTFRMRLPNHPPDKPKRRML